MTVTNSLTKKEHYKTTDMINRYYLPIKYLSITKGKKEYFCSGKSWQTTPSSNGPNEHHSDGTN
jgi:hypothetical protein